MYSQMYYEDHVKVNADGVIAAEVITSHGEKLLMQRIITCDKYAKEPEEIKREVRKQYQEALEK
jgi:hypothetical protein